jgi:hypothetical protein
MPRALPPDGAAVVEENQMPHLLRFFAGLVAVALPIALAGCGGGGSSGGSGGGGDGATLIEKNACQTCHSPTNSASDLSGSTKNLKPSYGKNAFAQNLTPDKTTGLGTWTDQEIKDAITKGKRNDGTLLCSVMPIFGTPCNSNEQTCNPPLNDADLTTIVDYLKGLKAVNHAVPKSPCTQ